jgi:hypothetical protein
LQTSSKKLNRLLGREAIDVFEVINPLKMDIGPHAGFGNVVESQRDGANDRWLTVAMLLFDHREQFRVIGRLQRSVQKQPTECVTLPVGQGARSGENVVKQCHLSPLTSLVRRSLRAPASRDITRGIAALGGSRSTRARAVCPSIRNGHDAGSHVAADADGIDRSAIQGVTRLTTTLGAIVCRSSEELGALKIPRVPSMVRK